MGFIFLCAFSASAINWPQISLTSYASGLSSPVDIQNAGDGSDRLFVVQQGGSIVIITNGTVVSPSFMNIGGRIASGGERGLLGLAFPPSFATDTNQHFYVYYTRASDGDIVIARYYVTSTNSNMASTNSEEILLIVDHSAFSNHNGGQLAFNPFDGYLYAGIGDGGSGGDPFEAGQSTTSRLGKILRMDVEPPNGTNYDIPPDNPFVGSSTNKQEIWAYGVRNPWRFCFDPLNGDLLIGDVGQGTYEEISYQAYGTTGGVNFGWDCMEGFHTYELTGCTTSALTSPIFEYAHTNGNCSITGGKMYRGTYYSYMYGAYFYCDYCTGKLSAVKYDGTNWQNRQFLATNMNVFTFGSDEDGEIYLAAGSRIYKIVETFSDADSDGIRDAWETYYGLNTNDASDAASDLDGDGMANIDEFLAGTEPSDSNDVFRMQTPENTNDALEAFTLQWTSESNLSYIVEKSTNLLNGFQDFITNPATPPLNSYTDALEGLNFYRIRLDL